MQRSRLVSSHMKLPGSAENSFSAPSSASKVEAVAPDRPVYQRKYPPLVTIVLHNPHSVVAILESRPLDVLELRLAPGTPSPAWKRVADLARENGLAVQVNMVKPPAGKPVAGKFERTGAAQATVRERPYANLDELFPAESIRQNRVWLALDCLQDPHNVGAIIRTAAFFRLAGIIVTKDRSAPLTGTVYDVASGGMEAVPICQPGNLAQAVAHAKEAGVWVVGASEHATKPPAQIPLDRPWLLVIGNEESGLRRLTLDNCDEICAITPTGQPLASVAKVGEAETGVTPAQPSAAQPAGQSEFASTVGSLNASVAAGILMAHFTGAVPTNK